MNGDADVNLYNTFQIMRAQWVARHHADAVEHFAAYCERRDVKPLYVYETSAYIRGVGQLPNGQYARYWVNENGQWARDGGKSRATYRKPKPDTVLWHNEAV